MTETPTKRCERCFNFRQFCECKAFAHLFGGPAHGWRRPVPNPPPLHFHVEATNPFGFTVRCFDYLLVGPMVEPLTFRYDWLEEDDG